MATIPFLTRALLAGILVGAGARVSQAQTRYSIVDLGVLPGATISYASGINDRGDVVGASATADNYFAQTGFVWKAGVLKSSGKLPKGQYSYATAINAAGALVGDGDTGNDRPQSWIDTGKGLINFFPNNGGNTHALFVGDSGFIGGYYTKSLSGWVSSWKSAIWLPDPKKAGKWNVVDLPVWPGGVDLTSTTAIPSAFNQSGQGVGYAQTDVIGQRACFWNNDAAHSIALLENSPEVGSSLANGLNDLGQAVGEVHPPFGSLPMFWNNDAAHTQTELPLLPGDNYGSATKINNLGQVLGYSGYGVPFTWDLGPSQPVLWRDGGVFPLQSLVEPTSGAGWTLTYASAINNRGQIVGEGLHNGKRRAFLMSPLP